MARSSALGTRRWVIEDPLGHNAWLYGFDVEAGL